MALGDSYATLDELKVFASLTGTSQFDETLTDALDSASREIETFCNRQFNKATTATARTFIPRSLTWAIFDDFWTSAGLVIKTDPAGDGTFGTTLSASQYQLLPRNGVVSGVTGWPFFKARALGGACFPRLSSWYVRSDTVEVTAQWGWAQVPAPVKQACLMLASKNFQVKDAPLGVAGSSEFGYVRVQDDRGAMGKLKPYKRELPLVG